MGNRRSEKLKEYYRVKADIHLDMIQNNLRNIRRILQKDTKLMVIVKADGYGHGAFAVAKIADSIADAYGVAIMQEGIELRKAGIQKPILILGYTPQEYFPQVIKFDLAQTVFQVSTAKMLAKEAKKQGKTASVHIKVDTGMGRIGFADTTESIHAIQEITQIDGITIDGIFTHFSCADEAQKAMTNKQLQRFLQFIKQLEQVGISIPIRHAANSAGIIEFPEAQLDLVRSGIATYGLYPSEFVKKERIMLQPALELKSQIVYLKKVPEGVPISYGATYYTKKPTKIATIPVGYADGYPRQLSSKGSVLIRQKRAPIIGRICMDQFMVDVSAIPEVKTGDCVTLIGKDGAEEITVEEVADLAGSFSYELICGLGKRIPREFFWENKKIGTVDYYDCIENTVEWDWK